MTSFDPAIEPTYVVETLSKSGYVPAGPVPDGAVLKIRRISVENGRLTVRLVYTPPVPIMWEQRPGWCGPALLVSVADEIDDVEPEAQIDQWDAGIWIDHFENDGGVYIRRETLEAHRLSRAVLRRAVDALATEGYTGRVSCERIPGAGIMIRRAKS